MFPRKDIYKYTQVSPDGRHKNQINHVLIRNRFKNGIIDVRTLRRADVDSDLLLVGIWIRVKFKKQYSHKLNAIDRYDIEKLEDVNKQKNYSKRISETLKKQQIISIDDGMMCGAKLTAKLTLEIEEQRKKPWFNKICEDAVQRRKTDREEWLKYTNNEQSAAEFSSWRKESHKIIRCEKEVNLKYYERC